MFFNSKYSPSETQFRGPLKLQPVDFFVINENFSGISFFVQAYSNNSLWVEN